MGLGFQGEKGVKVNRFWKIQSAFHMFPVLSLAAHMCLLGLRGIGSLPREMSTSHSTWVPWWDSRRGCEHTCHTSAPGVFFLPNTVVSLLLTCEACMS